MTFSAIQRLRRWTLSGVLALLSSPVSAQSNAPAGRSCHAMLYLPATRGVAVLGGARACGVDVLPDSSLWIWNGAKWSTLSQPFPGRREDVLVAYDSRQQRLLLHGGRASGTVHRDTWEWSSAVWRRISSGTESTAPSPIEHAAMAYDERRNRLVIFGGGSSDGKLFDATWELDGTRWERRDALGPSARVGHSMAWSPQDSAVLMYGGFNPSASLRDLWKWNGSAWTRLDSIGPATTEGPALLSTESGPILIGKSAVDSDSSTYGVWRWTRGRWSRLDQGPGPTIRVGQGIAYDVGRRRVVMFGGFHPATNTTSAETWEFDGKSWRLISTR